MMNRVAPYTRFTIPKAEPSSFWKMGTLARTSRLAAGLAVEKMNALIAEYLASPVVVTTMTTIAAGALAQGLL
jgi:hypothetical protein